MNHRFLEWFEKIQEEYDIPDGIVGGVENVVNFGGKRYSLFYVECIARIYNYSSKIDFKKVDSIFEIGGGFGANAHLLMHLFPNIRKYIYLDIPPNLYIGTQYLKCFFPNIIDYKQSAGRELIEFSDNDEREIFAIAPWQIERVNATVDCVWNSHSFVEMPINVVQNYAKYIKQFMRKKPPSSFLCMLTYDDFDLSTTFHPHKLLEIFGEFLTIEKINQQVNLQEIENRISYYFLGRIA
jgi:putative sugar O-methyltransferase